jgi:outer membrane lipoprotein-sorting protein
LNQLELMKRLVIALVAGTLLSGSIASLDAASAEELLRAHVRAIGGLEAHKKLTSRILRGELRMIEQGFTAQMVIRAKAPDKLRTELDIPEVGKIVEGFDGEVGWSENPFSGLTRIPPEQLARARRQADFYRDVELLSRYEQWTVQGKESVGGRPVHVIEGRSKDGTSETVYLDEANHWIVQVRTRDAGGETTVRLADYRAVDGVKIPFRIDLDAGQAGTYSLLLSEVRHGDAFDDKLFTMPAR